MVVNMLYTYLRKTNEYTTEYDTSVVVGYLSNLLILTEQWQQNISSTPVRRLVSPHTITHNGI